MATTLRVLIVEDSADDATLVERELRRGGYHLVSERVETADDMNAALARGGWDAVISDYSMPQFDALQALEVLKRRELDIPFIIVSGTAGEDTAVAAMKAGAQDFYVKGRLARLVPALERELREAQSRRERRQAYLALRESEERFRLLFEHNLAGVLRKILNGTVLDCNQAMARILGYDSPQEVEGLPGARLHYSQEERARLLSHLLPSGGVTNFEMRLRRKDGSPVWVIANTNLRHQSSGADPVVEGTFIDISDRKQTEIEISRLAAIVNSSEDAIYSCTREGVIITWNAGAEHMFGYTAEEIRGKHFSILIPEDLRPGLAANEETLLGGQALVHYELEHQRKDGSRLQALLTLSPIKNATGFVTGVSVITRDITERNRAEQSLRESEERFRATFENAGIGMALVDMQGRSFKSNPVLQQMLGYSEDELSRMVFTAYTHPGDRELDGRLYSELTAGKREKYEIEKRFIHKYGAVVWGQLTVSLIKGMHGQPVCAVGMVQDITERKQAEDALRRSEAYLSAGERMTHTGTWAWTLGSKELFWSRETYRIFGFDPEKDRADVYTTFLARVHPEDRPRIESQLQTSPPRDVVSYRIVLPDGSIRHLEENVFPVFDSSAKVIERFGVVRDVTERKQTEIEISRLAAIVTASDDAIYSTGPDGLIATWNAGAERLYGFTAEEMKGKHYTSLIPKDRRPESFRYRDKLFRGEAVVLSEFEHQHKDGSKLQLSLTLSPMRDAAGTVTGVCAIAHDISFRKRAEAELRASEERFRGIAETIDEVFWISDAEMSRMIYISPGYERVWGRPVESLYQNPRSFLDAIYQEDRDRVILLLTSQRQGLPFEHEYRIIHSDGSLRWIWDRGYPVRDPSGQVVHYVGVAQDITERKRAEAEKTRLVTAIEQSAEGIVITNTAGEIEYVNPAFTRITGYSRDEALGKNPRILKSGKQTPEIYAQMWETVLKGEIWHGEIINRRKDGKFYNEELNIAPVCDARGQITHFIATKQDVTGPRQLEQQFRQAQKMEAVGRLAGGVAHDFNNLLTVINGYSEMMMERLNDVDPLRPQIEEILKAGKRAASLTRQLLAFSRQQVLAPQVLNLNEVVTDVEKMLRRLIGEDIELVFFRHPELGRVRADPGQMEQILVNLAVNARDAMPEGGKLIIETANTEIDEVYALQHSGAVKGRYVMVAVSDNGIGMDAETQAQIFEPFFTTKEKGKGTGLGLSMVYGTVKQSGGFIWVYSEPGQGTTFKIYLPRIDDTQSPAPTHQMRKQTARGTETILLVEDEESVRTLTRNILQKLGYRVLESKSPEEALQIGEHFSETIHLLVTDVVMPRLSGRKVAEQLALSRPGLKVLYVSGYTDNAIVQHGVLNPNTNFLQKPFTPTALASKVREALEST